MVPVDSKERRQGVPVDASLRVARRRFLGQAGVGIGMAALAELLQCDLFAQSADATGIGALPGLPHFAPKAKRVIYLFQSGAPSQLDLFDYKPCKNPRHGSPRVDPQRSAPDGDDCRADKFSDRPVDLQVRAVRAIGRVAQRVASAHGEGRR